MGWLEQGRLLVLCSLVMPLKEEMQLLVKQRPDTGKVEVHDLFSLWTPGWPYISHVSLGRSSSPTLWEGGTPSEVRFWMSYQPQWSTLLNQPFGSWSKIRKVPFIHMFFHQSHLPGCGAFISLDAEQGIFTLVQYLKIDGIGGNPQACSS